MQSPCAKITVGKGTEERTYFIHKHILEAKSEYFRACLNGNFAESNGDGEIKMAEDDPAAFNHVVDWLYGNALQLESFSDSIAIVDLYIFADKIMCCDLKDIAVDLLQEYYEGKVIRFEALQKLSDRHLVDSKAMEFLVQEAGYDIANYYHDVFDLNGWLTFLALEPDLTKRIMDEAHAL